MTKVARRGRGVLVRHGVEGASTREARYCVIWKDAVEKVKLGKVSPMRWSVNNEEGWGGGTWKMRTRETKLLPFPPIALIT